MILLMFSSEELLKLKRGVKLFNSGHYWECHEEIEDLWIEELGPVRYVYWAIIQLATALYHFEDENFAGARGMLHKTHEKVLKAQKGGAESDLLFRFLKWKIIKDRVLSLDRNKGNELEILKSLEGFKFSNPDKWEQHFE
ncbi:MAG: DUF309 domain-containing protein [Bacteriovoracaceae bacterium]